jgi:hypothetical protein
MIVGSRTPPTLSHSDISLSEPALAYLAPPHSNTHSTHSARPPGGGGGGAIAVPMELLVIEVSMSKDAAGLEGARACHRALKRGRSGEGEGEGEGEGHEANVGGAVWPLFGTQGSAARGAADGVACEQWGAKRQRR